MFEWLSDHYLQLIANFAILLANPSACYAVSYLKAFTFTLLALLAIKLILHHLVFRFLKRSFSQYDAQDYPELLSAYRRAARNLELRRTPALYRFADRKPLAFTIGVWRPCVFVAPQLVERLAQSELAAVLVHELSHAQRYDNLRRWLTEVVLALVPALVIQLFALQFVFSGSASRWAIWSALGGIGVFRFFANGPLQSIRERFCDDLTVGVIKDPLVLASSLIHVWRLGASVSRYNWGIKAAFIQPFAGCHRSFERRVERLLDYRRPRWKFLLIRVNRVLLAVSALVVIAFLVRFHSVNRLTGWEANSICSAVPVVVRLP